jgi:hypothetical protein
MSDVGSREGESRNERASYLADPKDDYWMQSFSSSALITCVFMQNMHKAITQVNHSICAELRAASLISDHVVHDLSLLFRSQQNEASPRFLACIQILIHLCLLRSCTDMSYDQHNEDEGKASRAARQSSGLCLCAQVPAIYGRTCARILSRAQIRPTVMHIRPTCSTLTLHAASLPYTRQHALFRR